MKDEDSSTLMVKFNPLSGLYKSGTTWEPNYSYELPADTIQRNPSFDTIIFDTEITWKALKSSKSMQIHQEFRHIN